VNQSKRGNYLLFGIIIILSLIYCFFESRGGGDFLIFLSASNDIFNGVDVYEKHYVDGYHYYYGIFFGILLKPLTFLPFQLAKFLWLALNAFFLFRIVKICLAFFPVNEFTPRQKFFFVFLPLLFCLRFILDNFHLAQITILVLYLSLEGCRLILLENKSWGAALLALGINIKLFPLVLIPLLFYRKKFMAGGLVILFTAALYFLPALFIGTAQNNFLLSSWWHLVNPASAKHVLDVEERTFHSISTLFSTLFVAHEKVPDMYQLALKRNIADVDLETLGLLINLARLALISFTLFFLKTLPFKNAKNNLHAFAELSYILMIVPLIFPHQQAYGFLFVLPAVVCIIYFLITNPAFWKSWNGKSFIFLLALIYASFNLKLLLGQFNEFYQHFKLLTYGALILIPLLAISIKKIDLSH
jgi:hypothetical protein